MSPKKTVVEKSDEGRPRFVVRAGDVPWQAESSTGGRVRFERKKLGAAAGGRRLGCSLVRMDAGSPSWPRHYHTANEEAVYVLDGRGTLVAGDERIPIAAGDYAALPAGPAHAHKVVNESEGELVFLCFSTMVHPDVVVYPDSGKIGVFVGSAPGGAPEESELKRFLDGSAEIDYWRDEE